MKNREFITKKIKAIESKIELLNSQKRELDIQLITLCDDVSQYKESLETSGKGKNKITRLIGRKHFKQIFMDGDTKQTYSMDRSMVVRIDGEWQF